MGEIPRVGWLAGRIIIVFDKIKRSIYVAESVRKLEFKAPPHFEI